MSKIKYRADIDGLRAIAILSVLIFHLDAKYLSGGFVGVDIFFVISGFLITSIIKKEIEETSSFNFKNFYIRRIRRLFPALFVTLAITTIIVAFIFSPTHLSSYGGSLVTSLLSVSNFFFWVESDYFDVSSKVKPLLHTWTLSIEEQFYLIWPITLLF
ncbi:acyltransferase [Aliarcobacter butzleri JV22]|nr:acyltransferase [Aliarcobacter butzleri]EFU70275.1 acyltransferase [Aliarcobacter butzleri JV22]